MRSATLISQLMYYVLNKADASVTQDMVDDEFTINDPRLIEIAHAIAGEKADRPYLTALHLLARTYGWSKQDMDECTVSELNILIAYIEQDQRRAAQQRR